MYYITSLISAWIRQLYLPNPFATIISPSYADIFNILINEGGVIPDGKFPIYNFLSVFWAVGISYLFWYSVNTFIFIGVGKITTSLVTFSILVLIVYIAIILLISNISNKARYDALWHFDIKYSMVYKMMCHSDIKCRIY